MIGSYSFMADNNDSESHSEAGHISAAPTPSKPPVADATVQGPSSASSVDQMLDLNEQQLIISASNLSAQASEQVQGPAIADDYKLRNLLDVATLDAGTQESKDKMIQFEAEWRADPKSQCLSINEAFDTSKRANMCIESDRREELTGDDIREMAIGFYKLSVDPEWNYESGEKAVAALFPLFRIAQLNQRRDHTKVDKKYMTGVSLAWDDEKTVLTLNAASLYYRYRGLVSTLDVRQAALFLNPYMRMIMHLKIVLERKEAGPVQIGTNSTRNQKKSRRGRTFQADAAMEDSDQDKADENSNVQGLKKAKAKRGRDSSKVSALQDVQPAIEKSRRGLPQSHPQHVIDGTIQWLRSTKEIDTNLQRYHKSLCQMWTSGEFEWTRMQQIPTPSQVYYWIRNSRRKDPPQVAPRVLMSSQKKVSIRQQGFKRMATVFKARQFDYSGRTAGQMAFNKSSESVAILLHLHNDESSLRSILFLAQVSKKTNTCIIKLELYTEVRRMVQGSNMDIDAKLVLKQLEYSAESAEKEGSIPRPAKKPSSTQLTVDFSGLPVHQQQHALNRFKGDYKDTIVNLGDALKTERLVFLGEGGFGS